MIRIIGIRLTDRIKEVGLTQEVLSKHANVITTRFGFHELTSEVCSREAYIILHLNGDEASSDHLLKDLSSVGGITVKEMNFEGKPKEQKGGQAGDIRILGLLIEKDHDLIIAVQKLLSSYGCVIRARLGVNEKFFGKPAGLIILELAGDSRQMDFLERDLSEIKKLHLRKIVF